MTISSRSTCLLMKASTAVASSSLSTLTSSSSTFYEELSEKEKREYSDSLELYNQLKNSNDPLIKEKVDSALDTLEAALRIYTPEQLYASFNGGKDAVVIFHLIRAAIAKYSSDNNIHYSPRFVYFGVEDEFDEVKDFIDETIDKYNINLEYYEEGIGEGLKKHISKIGPSSAFVLGTREGDPNSVGQEKFTPSSSWMPIFMRVNPIIDWNYECVWYFLRKFKLPYCTLYDDGYTSLGGKSSTKPNSALLKNGHNGSYNLEYWPAFMLADGSLERSGRENKKIETEVILDGNETSDVDKLRAKSVALLVVGNEILNGFVQDKNIAPAAKLLKQKGLNLERVSICKDDVDEISREIKELRKEYDCIITAGGVGPTHDDVTIKAIASSLNTPVEVNQEMVNFLQEFKQTTELDASTLDQAKLPINSKLKFPPGANSYPVLQCENIFVLPGVPHIFEKKMEQIVTFFIVPLDTMSKKLILMIDKAETAIATDITTLSQEFGNEIELGSYPHYDSSSACSNTYTVVTIEGQDAMKVDTAAEKLLSIIGQESILSVRLGV